MSSNIFFIISLPSFIHNKLARITETSLFEHLSANISPIYLTGILLYSFRLGKLWLQSFFTETSDVGQLVSVCSLLSPRD
ncbi:uncharacterized protein OCT59_005812 [Rhizophagus irregularis]|uniref:Uncharacterized protein n=1 Tax=Rhizophagus irregularis TaxID=588596 RepID=A0A916E5S3_9GLOM|nr:hypothetical protein OCT59_005812 [Rhizophagus irregularis]GBC38015.1 hypothetical protein RIR_jg4384.t1 [Rhizophagus irregularis DAOM 181602=DAOM 197198]CAB4479514.1 unnamed protein product [Rhizophagus irregularis]CAB5185762.1 unnamed protein product [Rhizophagus irregularis]CAB5364604.1 unnamed protein product [Rhizophagus irregularis]